MLLQCYSCVMFVTCSAVVSLGELDLDLVLPGDVLDAATFRPHDGTVVALRDSHLHAHLGLLLETGDSNGNNGTDRESSRITPITSGCKIMEHDMFDSTPLI